MERISPYARKYHKEVFWKDWFDEQCQTIIDSVDVRTRDSLSRHAFDTVTGKDERHGHNVNFTDFCRALNLIKNDGESYVFECVADRKNVFKCVVRAPYDDYSDISIVFVNGRIISVWLNDLDDVHTTLDPSKYEQRL